MRSHNLPVSAHAASAVKSPRRADGRVTEPNAGACYALYAATPQVVLQNGTRGALAHEAETQADFVRGGEQLEGRSNHLKWLLRKGRDSGVFQDAYLEILCAYQRQIRHTARVAACGSKDRALLCFEPARQRPRWRTLPTRVVADQAHGRSTASSAQCWRRPTLIERAPSARTHARN